MIKLHERNTVIGALTLSALDKCGFGRRVTDKVEFARWVNSITDVGAAKEVENLSKTLGRFTLLLLEQSWDGDGEEPLEYTVSADIEGFAEVDFRGTCFADTFAEIFWSDAEDDDNTEILSALIESADPMTMLRVYSNGAYVDEELVAERLPDSFELVVHLDMTTRKEVAFGIATSDNRIAVYR